MARGYQHAAARKPQGQPTRGKTAPNRLRRVDNFLALYDPSLIRREDNPFAGALYVDLGYGADPVTTLESAARLRRLNPTLQVLGVEIDPERVAAAQPFADALTAFRLGGFNLPLAHGETVRCIRALNVLRQYEESEVAGAYTLLARSLLPGGLLIEGTSEPYGRLWVANVLRLAGPHPGPLPRGEGERSAHLGLHRRGEGERSAHLGLYRRGEGERSAHLGLHRRGEGERSPHAGPLPRGEGPELRHEALVFSTNFRLGFAPADFQAVLPKNLIHRVVPGEPIHEFFADWKQAALETAAVQVWGARQWFRASAERLAEQGYRVSMRSQLLNAGFLVLLTDGPPLQPVLRTQRNSGTLRSPAVE